MTLQLQKPPPAYDAGDQVLLRDQIERADRETLKRGRDCEVGDGRIILTDHATGLRYALKVTGGTLSAVAV